MLVKSYLQGPGTAAEKQHTSNKSHGWFENPSKWSLRCKYWESTGWDQVSYTVGTPWGEMNVHNDSGKRFTLRQSLPCYSDGRGASLDVSDEWKRKLARCGLPSGQGESVLPWMNLFFSYGNAEYLGDPRGAVNNKVPMGMPMCPLCNIAPLQPKDLKYFVATVGGRAQGRSYRTSSKPVTLVCSAKCRARALLAALRVLFVLLPLDVAAIVWADFTSIPFPAHDSITVNLLASKLK
eukprot:TRINITY_DN53193_c0_g1_i2.p1 TRINITY_DN53193_c0_g1~~TRINITY_DN53193_c0_g1_i2.p1  ORF type:complete len:237 (+),score=13.35 TRINITY_DN53193_c0_g1_i2:124-834(+)